MTKAKVIRVSVNKLKVDGKIEAEGRWYLSLVDDRLPIEDTPIDDPRILAMVGLNKVISRYLREILSMIEDELPEEG